MSDGLQLSARMVASLLAGIFGPSFYDLPRYGRRDLSDFVLGDPVPWRAGPQPEPWREGPHPEPWRAVLVNPGASYSLALADAHIQELLTLDHMGTLSGGEVMERTLQRALRLVADIDELCPRWPPWPKRWPPPPPPPPWWREEMASTELFVFGARVLGASEVMEQGKLQEALTALGEKALGLSMRG